MRGYSRVDEDLDEYENDELEEYGSIEGDEYEEEEEEEVEEQDPTPTKEVQDLLALRQKLKEDARRRLAKQSGSGSNTRDSKRPKVENFGSFFGPNRPVISERVIQASKSFLETRQDIPRNSSSQKDSRKGQVSSTSAPPRDGMTSRRPHNPIKTKVQKIKDTRDYSFLLSDDADVPTTAANAAPLIRSNSVPAQVPSKSRESGHAGRQSSNGAGERRPGAAHSHIRPGQNQKPPPSTRPDSTRRERLAVPEHKKHYPVSGHGNGTGRPSMPKEVSSSKDSHLTKKVPSHLERKVTGVSADRKAPAASIVKKPSAAVAKLPMPNGQRPHLLKQQTLGGRQQLEERTIQRPNKGTVLPKQTSSSLKPQMKAPKQIPPRLSREDDLYRSKPQSQLRNPQSQLRNPQSQLRNPQAKPKPKPKPIKRLSEEDDAILEIRKMFGYNPNKYDDDGDLSDMEVGFNTIQREERKSALIARKEDEEEFIKIQEEEERERRRKLAKRKMSQR